jgi:hypothetical protein
MRRETTEKEMAEENEKYLPDNWAHQALLLMDDADALVRFAAVNMPDAEKYTKAAKAFWDVCQMLAEERNKLHNALGQGSAACGASPAPMGSAAHTKRGNRK